MSDRNRLLKNPRLIVSLALQSLVLTFFISGILFNSIDRLDLVFFHHSRRLSREISNIVLYFTTLIDLRFCGLFKDDVLFPVLSQRFLRFLKRQVHKLVNNPINRQLSWTFAKFWRSPICEYVALGSRFVIRWLHFIIGSSNKIVYYKIKLNEKKKTQQNNKLNWIQIIFYSYIFYLILTLRK